MTKLTGTAKRQPFNRDLVGVAFCMFVALCGRMPAMAQAASQVSQAVKSLDSTSQAVVGRLDQLNRLSADEWRYHAGDMAHGESTEMDDSSWQLVKARQKGAQEAEWFRRWIEVPKSLHGYDLTGARIWFSFNASANGPMPEIIYFNGRRVALGDDLEPIVLFDKAQPGDKVLVAVKLLHTVDNKTFAGAELKIDFAENRPNPEDLRKEIVSAALLVPSLSKTVAADTATLEKAAGAVDIAALDAGDQNKFDASLKQAQSTLEQLKPMLQQATLHLTGNSHIDAAWLWPWTETVDVVKRTFGTALQLMNEYPDYTYTQSAAAYNEWIADKYPQMNDEIKQRIKEGRWEIVGGMWVEPDLNMPDGESLVRQLLVGKRWFQKEYGVDTRIGWNPDSFGYTWQLPQIYKKSGVDYFVTQKMAWNDTNQMPFKFFWWESPDGSKVLAYFPHDYANDNLNPVRLSRDFAIAREHTPGLTSMMDLYGIGDHGGGPTRAILDEGNHWASPGHVTPKIEYGTAQSYFSSLEKQIAPDSPVWDYKSIAKGYTPPPAVEGKVSIPTWKSELYFEYHRGVMTTQAGHKRNMRDSEVEVLDAEKWASLAWVLGGRAYPGAELTEDWKKVLFNQFHDLAAGSGIGVIYKDAQKDYDVVRWSTNEIDAGALGTVAENVNTGGNGIPVMVYNPLGWERSGEVSVKVQLPSAAPFAVLDGATPVGYTRGSLDTQTGVQELRLDVRGVPALGYKTLHVVSGDSTNPSPASTVASGVAGLSIENSNLRVSINKDSGCITSIFDKRSGFEALAPNACGNQLQFFKDTPKDYDAWNVDPGTYDVPPSVVERVDMVQAIQVSPNTPSSAFRVTRTWQNSKFVQTISLKGDLVDIDNEIDWHESHVLLKAAFPLAVTSDHATYDIPYGTIERPTTRNNSWEKAQFEVEAMRWADLSGAGADGKVHGLSVINDSKYGYDAAGNTLRLTLLRSPKWPDADADMGHQHFHYALYPHAGTWKDALTVRHGYEYNYPLTAVVTTAHAGSLPASRSFASVEPENVVLTAVKKAEDANGLIFRVYEWAGKETTAVFHVPPGATGATVTNLMEKPEGAALTVTGDSVTAPIHPFEILTVRVDYPASQ